MISYLIGTIHDKNKGSVVVLTNAGVGYEVSLQVDKLTSWQVGDNIALYIYMKVAETSMELFGFETKEEKKFFELLLSVKGVGPKGALNILSLGSIIDIQNAIARADVGYLTQVSGIGKRTAERMCVELKSKVGRVTSEEGRGIYSGVLGDVVEGLVAMGYSKEEARESVQTLDTGGKDTEKLLREALKSLSRNV